MITTYRMVGVSVLRASFPQCSAFELAVSHALLMRVASGELESLLRVFCPGPTLAFGKLDALRPGYAAAADVARRHGFEPVLRLAGGHAAAYDGESLIVERIVPVQAIAQGIHERFETMTTELAGAIGALGVEDVRVGELPGEYCAGTWSINVEGRVKVAGIAQRIIRGAALVTAVVVVGGGDRIRAALVDTYDALGIDWSPDTAGAIDEVLPGVDAATLAVEIGGGDEQSLDAETLALAAKLEAAHAVA